MNIHDFIPENGITRVNKRKYNAVVNRDSHKIKFHKNIFMFISRGCSYY